MMRSILCSLALAAMMSCGTQASEGFDDLVKLAKAGVGEDVLLAFVNAQAKPYTLTVDEILYLNDIGVPGSVVAAAIRSNDPAKLAGGALLEPQPAPLEPVAKAEVPAVTPPLAPDYDAAVKEAVAKASGQKLEPGQPVVTLPGQTPAPQDPFGPALDPVIGRPEPVVAQIPAQPATRPVQPAYEAVQQPATEVREVIVERVVEKPVYIERPVYISETVVTAPPEDRLNVSFFYESLSPYGTWLSVDNDYYWQPSVVTVDRSWRPYWNNGNWVYTDYGWTWQSSYSWGWAPFHYGRWTCHSRHGWIWRPDTVWAPAWVHWRSNNDYYGWAPLPPEARYEAGLGFHYRGKNVSLDFHFGLGERDYAFVPSRNFCDHDFHRHGSYYGYNRGPQVVNIYKNTTVVNNYYRYDRDRIINNGPGYDSIRRATNREIKPVRISDAQYRPGERIHATTLREDSLQIYRPNIRRDTPETPQAAIARRERDLQAQRAAQAEREAQRQSLRENANNTGRFTTAEAARRAEQEAQRVREAASRTNPQRTDIANRERNEQAAREEQRRAQQQQEQAARETARRAEQAREEARELQRVQQANRERQEAAQREEQRRAERQAEATAREQARLAEQQQQAQREAQRRQEAAVREQAEQAQRQAEAAAREEAHRTQQSRIDAQEQQRRLDQAQREAQRQIENAQRDAQRQAEQQARAEQQREMQVRQQHQAASRQTQQQAAREEAARQQQINEQRRAEQQQVRQQQSARETDGTNVRQANRERQR